MADSTVCRSLRWGAGAKPLADLITHDRVREAGEGVARHELGQPFGELLDVVIQDDEIIEATALAHFQNGIPSIEIGACHPDVMVCQPGAEHLTNEVLAEPVDLAPAAMGGNEKSLTGVSEFFDQGFQVYRPAKEISFNARSLIRWPANAGDGCRGVKRTIEVAEDYLVSHVEITLLRCALEEVR